MTAAEVAFAAGGFQRSSLRKITMEAGANLASVHYHFGSKEKLLLAVFSRLIQPVNRERLRQLDGAEARHGPDPVPVEELLRIFLGPVVKRLKGGGIFPRLLARMHQDPHPAAAKIAGELLRPIVARFMGALGRAAPHLSETQILLRGGFLFGAMAQTFGAGSLVVRAVAGEEIPHDPDLLLEELIQFGAAGFCNA